MAYNDNDKIKLLREIKSMVIENKESEYNSYIDKIKKYSGLVKPTGNPKFGISTSQIRIIFGELKKINKNESLLDLQKLRMKLAYAGGRGNSDLKEFITCLDEIIVLTKDAKGINKLYEFVEGVICYLKFYGDKN